jgi:hypothetical protein
MPTNTKPKKINTTSTMPTPAKSEKAPIEKVLDMLTAIDLRLAHLELKTAFLAKELSPEAFELKMARLGCKMAAHLKEISAQK